MKYDLIVVGAGIVGLAHAYEAQCRGLRVAVVERNAKCTGASIRNFGFITVSGQARGDTWRRARTSVQVWKQIAAEAGIALIHTGSWVVCQRPEAADVAMAFMDTEMGLDCSFYAPNRFHELRNCDGVPLRDLLRLKQASGILHSKADLRVESRDAIGKLAYWLQKEKGIDFFFNESLLWVDMPEVLTSSLRLKASRLIACPGAEFNGPFKAAFENYEVQMCTLQMLRVSVKMAGRLPGSVMTDNSLARYKGWAELPQSIPLQQRIQSEMPEFLGEGIHLIAVQSEDGSLVLGDSHVYGNTEQVFARDEVDELILKLARDTLMVDRFKVVERWQGMYPSSARQDAFIHAISDSVRLVSVTSGTGASTSFGLAKDTFDHWGIS
jgi:D-hydroxyproline dehydrogenase subunit beta